MRDLYYKFITENKIINILELINEVPFSTKLKILEELLKRFESYQIINRALERYKINYIDLNRVLICRIKNTLIYYCREEENKCL